MFPILKCCLSAADGNSDNCRHNQISHRCTPTSVRHVNGDDVNSKHVDYSEAENKDKMIPLCHLTTQSKWCAAGYRWSIWLLQYEPGLAQTRGLALRISGMLSH